MTNVFAGLLAAGLMVPAHGEGIRVVTPVSHPTSLPYYPIPVTSIGRPAIQLPSPALPLVGFPKVTPRFNLTASLPSPVTVPVARLPEPALPIVAVRPGPEYPVESPRRISGPVGIPVTVKSKINLASHRLASGKLEAASASLRAVFDSAEKPSAPAVEVKDDEKKADESPVLVESERRVTLPEWDLEHEIGINPVESTW